MYPREGRDVLGLDGVDSRTTDRLVQRSERLAASEYDVGRVLDLHQAPVVTEVEFLDDRTALAGVAVEQVMKLASVEPSGELLCPFIII